MQRYGDQEVQENIRVSYQLTKTQYLSTAKKTQTSYECTLVLSIDLSFGVTTCLFILQHTGIFHFPCKVFTLSVAVFEIFKELSDFA